MPSSCCGVRAVSAMETPQANHQVFLNDQNSTARGDNPACGFQIPEPVAECLVPRLVGGGISQVQGSTPASGEQVKSLIGSVKWIHHARGRLLPHEHLHHMVGIVYSGRKLHLGFFRSVKVEVHDVAIFHEVVFALHGHFTGLLAGHLTAELDEIRVFDDSRPDEAFLEIGVNHASGLRSP